MTTAPGVHVRYLTPSGVRHGDVVRMTTRTVTVISTLSGENVRRLTGNVQPVLHEHRPITADECEICGPILRARAGTFGYPT